MLAGSPHCCVKTYGVLGSKQERIYKMRTFAEISAVQKSGKMNSPIMIGSGCFEKKNFGG